jgi:hypothetical protein
MNVSPAFDGLLLLDIQSILFVAMAKAERAHNEPWIWLEFRAFIAAFRHCGTVAVLKSMGVSGVPSALCLRKR